MFAEEAAPRKGRFGTVRPVSVRVTNARETESDPDHISGGWTLPYVGRRAA